MIRRSSIEVVPQNYNYDQIAQQIPSRQQSKFSVLAAILAVIVAVVVFFLKLLIPSRSTYQMKLSFRPNRTFKILQLTDLHYGEDPFTDWGPQQDIDTSRLIRRVLALEQPDLVLLTGDQLTANNVNGNATLYYELLCQLLEANDTNVPYAMTFGNHDDATFVPPPSFSETTEIANTTLRSELMAYMERRVRMQPALSLSRAGPSSVFGVSNSVLNVFESATSGNIRLQIMLLDSGGGSIPQQIINNQLEWYRQQRALRSSVSRPVDAIAFQHIPTQQFLFVSDTEDDAICQGLNGENGIAPIQNDPTLETNWLYQDMRLHFLAAGHNHGNSYCCRYTPNINQTANRAVPLHLCFGRHSGYGGYGSWARGARVYEMTWFPEDPPSFAANITWRSWVRLDSGDKTDIYEPFR
jgi:Calcineurin-like phosphoesterase